MKINFVRLQNFRNIEFAQVDFAGRHAWIYGDNAQGKTNLLESVGLLGALRSFRSAKPSAMLRKGCGQAKVLARISSETRGETEVELWLGGKRSILLDGEEVKYSDFIGLFPIVAAANEDIWLVRGAPEGRRRELDMFISSLDAEYLRQLRRFHTAMAGRNALLRQQCRDGGAFAAFEAQMAESAAKLSYGRKRYLDGVAEKAGEFYAKLASDSPDRANITLRMSCDYSDPAAYAAALLQNRHCDSLRGSTSSGPHRDDFSFDIDGGNAKTYASEGQQRSLVLAFRLAQFEVSKAARGSEPVLLCDDILAELDAKRRRAFWSCISASCQVIATATTPPPAESPLNWKPIVAADAKFLPLEGAFANNCPAQ